LSTIEKIEAGERRPSRQVAELIAESLGIPEGERMAFLRFARAEPRQTPPGAQTIPPPEAVGAGQPAPWRALQRRLTNLSVPLTPLIGREQDLAAVKSQLLRDTVRLLTLTGPAGVGKTRLGTAVATELADHFEDGVFFVPLAPITDAELVVSAIASTLGLKEAAGEPSIEALKDYLAGKRMLLVLDNFEQVVEAAPGISELLAASPWLKALVTSREALRVRGERQFSVQPLPLPDLGRVTGAGELAKYPAVSLFVERAQSVDPAFKLVDGNALSVAEICVRLEGLPLAIELVASRSNLLPPQALLEGLNSRLAGQMGDLRDLPARHRTMRDAIGWSYDLLKPGEQTLLRRLGVFVGGCTRSAVEAVCNSWGDLPMDVGAGLGSLIDKSLLRSETVRGEPRFTMLEMLREYALEQLQESGELDALRRLHAEYNLALAEAAEPELAGPQQAELLDWLEREHDNLRSALNWSLDCNEGEIALRLSGALGQFWYVHGHLSEGRRWLQETLARASKQPPLIRARALTSAALLAYKQGDHAHAIPLYEKSLAIYTELGERKNVAFVLNRLGVIANEQGDYARADRLYQESLSLFREVGDKWGIAVTLNNLGNQELARGNVDRGSELFRESLRLSQELGDKRSVNLALLNLGRVALYHQGNFPRAMDYLQQSLDLCRELGNKSGTAATLYQLGWALLYQGDHQRAEDCFEESLSLCREVGEKPGIAVTLHGLGLALLLQGGYEQAQDLLQESLAMLQALGNNQAIIGCVEALAGLMGLRAQVTGAGELEALRAAKLFGAADALRDAANLPVGPAHKLLYDALLAPVRAQLDEQAFEEAWTAGRGMSLEQLVADASDQGL
ncbi:MAG: tetratricopeptide repeat protein, partial [Chloroflexota bacterium]|nr:tetratricopeptide repeat protein [Chloroflexota bacterium]